MVMVREGFQFLGTKLYNTSESTVPANKPDFKSFDEVMMMDSFQTSH